MATALSALERFGTYKHEGHFIYLFSDGLARIQSGQINGNSILHEEGAPQRFLKAFTHSVNRMFSARADPRDTLWIDKTPDLAQLRAVPVIARLWPTARFVFLYRPAADAVRSSHAVWREQLAGRERETAERWRDCQSAWRAGRDGLKRDRYVEIYQPDMLAKPRAVAGQLKPLLQLSDDEVEHLARIWTRNRTINRPTGARGDAYDAVRLTPEAAAAVLSVTKDEVAHWPTLVAALGAGQTEKDSDDNV